MKEKFELYCKVVGLIFFCIAILYKDSPHDIDLNASNKKDHSVAEGEYPDGKYAPPGYLQ